MTTTGTPAGTPAPTPAPTASTAGRAPSGPSWWGIRTVAVLEARQRLRSTRWKIALGVWFVVVGLVTLGVVSVAKLNMTSVSSPDLGQDSGDLGRAIFGLVLLFVLFLGLLVAPTLSATSINGDRGSGTLAVLQATTLSRWDIALGKLLASWGAALAFLAVSLPFLLWGLAYGGTSPLRAIGSVLTVAVLLLVVCAVGLAMSAVTSRTSGSAVLTYLIVAGLSAGTLIAFGLSAMFLRSTAEVRVYGIDWSSTNSDTDEPTIDSCEWRVERRDVWHSEYLAWLLGLNPFVIVADVGGEPSTGMNDPLSAISGGVRYAQAGPELEVDECWYADDYESRDVPAGAPYWPWSIAGYAVLGGLSVWTVARRLDVPAVHLPRGQRIA